MSYVSMIDAISNAAFVIVDDVCDVEYDADLGKNGWNRRMAGGHL